MRTEDIDRLWSQALHEAVWAGEAFTRYRFAALIAAAEREACARICDEHADDPVYCGSAIRARS